MDLVAHDFMATGTIALWLLAPRSSTTRPAPIAQPGGSDRSRSPRSQHIRVRVDNSVAEDETRSKTRRAPASGWPIRPSALSAPIALRHCGPPARARLRPGAGGVGSPGGRPDRRPARSAADATRGDVVARRVGYVRRRGRAIPRRRPGPAGRASAAALRDARWHRRRRPRRLRRSTCTPSSVDGDGRRAARCRSSTSSPEVPVSTGTRVGPGVATRCPTKSELLEQRAEHARPGRGSRWASARERRRAARGPTTATSPPRTCEPRRVDVYGALASPLPAGRRARRRAPPGCASSPRPERARWSAGGHSVVRGRRRRHALPGRLGDHGALPPAARRAPGHPPAASTWSATSPARCRRWCRSRRRRRAADGRGARVVDARRDRPARRGRRRRRRWTRRCSGCCATSARRSRTGRAMHAGSPDRRGTGDDPPPRCRPTTRSPGARPAAVAGRRSTSPSSATASTRLERRRRRRSCCGPCPAPGWASCAPTRRWRARPRAGCPSRSGRGPREDAAGAGQGQLPRHRAPAGVPRLRRGEDLRRDGEVVGERRFLGLFSSAAYTESVTRIPLLRERAAEVLRRSGFDPRSHAGKALMDTLETYPRDELFHTGVDELAPMAEAAMHARERRAAAGLRAPRHLRPLRLGAGLPAPRPLQHRGAASGSRDPHRAPGRRLGRVHGRASTSPPPPGCTSWCTRARARPSPEVDDGRPGAAAGRGLPLLARRLHAAVVDRVRRGGRRPVGRRYADSFPEAYKEDFSARARRRSTWVGSRRSRATRTGIDLSLYEQLDAGRGEARLKVFRVGEPLSLSEVLPMLSSMGVEVVDERPYELDGLERRSYVYEFGLRYGTSAARRRPRAVPGRAARGLGRPQRDRRLQRAGARAPA